jgi:hypothetical protein
MMDGITQEVEEISQRPDLPYLDAVGMRKLAVMLVQTVEADSAINDDVRGALIGTAAILVKHSRDLVGIAVDTEQMMALIKQTADKYYGSDQGNAHMKKGAA